MRLPPYGKRFLEEDSGAGPWVAIGSGAWKFAGKKPFPVMLCPDKSDPADFHWPVQGLDVILIETGRPDDARLKNVVQIILESGARMVLAIREALLGLRKGQSPGSFFYRDLSDAR